MKIEPSTTRGIEFGGLDIGREHIGQQLNTAKSNAEDDTNRDADLEAGDGLIDGGVDLLPERADRGAVL